MRKLLIVTILFLMAVSLAAKWDLQGNAKLTLNQNAYSDNWAGSEESSVSWTFNFDFTAQKQLSEKIHNKNSLQLAFGQTHQKNAETDKWDRPEKTTDLIDFESMFKLTLGAFVDPYLAGRFESQFLDESNPEETKTLNPMQFTESAGIAKTLIQQEKQNLITRLGFAVRQNINRDVMNEMGEKETLTTNDGGMNWVTEYSKTFANDQMTFSSNLRVFQAVFNSEADDLEGDEKDYWKTADIDWENTLNISITKYVVLDLYTQLLYDKELDLAGRFKQTLGLGLTYKLL